jgi:hypothetical protein
MCTADCLLITTRPETSSATVDDGWFGKQGLFAAKLCKICPELTTALGREGMDIYLFLFLFIYLKRKINRSTTRCQSHTARHNILHTLSLRLQVKGFQSWEAFFCQRHLDTLVLSKKKI